MVTQLPLPKMGTEPPSQFSAHVYCDQTAGWIKMALGMEVGLGPGHIVLCGDSALLPKKGAEPPQFLAHFLLLPNGWMHQDATCYGGRPQPRRLCVRRGPSPPSPKEVQPQFSANVRCGQAAGWTKMPLGIEVGLGSGDCVRWGPSYPQKKGTPTPTQFLAHV